MTRRLPTSALLAFVFLTLVFAAHTTANPPTLAWARSVDGYADDLETAAATLTDPEGNIYVTGSRSDTEFITMKLDPLGNVIWQARVPLSQNGLAPPSAIARDNNGNIIITGSVILDTTANDFITIKYDSEGNLLWLARYDGPSHGHDISYALAVDNDNNVFVTGYSTSSASAQDYATVKYSADGIQQWVARYDGPAGSYDAANAVIIDRFNQVVVVGGSTGIGSDLDLALVYYDQQGNQLRVIRYNGPANSTDYGVALATDDTGDIYAAGYATTIAGGSDCITLKYASDGTLLWTALYDGPTHNSDAIYKMALDGDGNVIVVGSSAGSNNSPHPVAIKYDANGIQQWAARYESGSSSYDQFRAMTLDYSGNVLVTFKSPTYNNGNLATAKYLKDGTLQWVASYDDPAHSDDGPRGVATDSAGNVFVLGTCSRIPPSNFEQDYGMTVVKYSSSGSQLAAWPLAFRGNGLEFPYTVKPGPDNRIYVSGDSDSLGYNSDIFTICYDAGGGILWQALYDGPSHQSDHSAGLAVASSGNVYIAGTTKNVGTGNDFVTAKYDPVGNKEWAVSYDGYGLNDYVAAVTIDDAENVYITGYAKRPSSPSLVRHDAVTIKYDTHGVQQWIAHYRGQLDVSADGMAVAVDEQGNVFVGEDDCCTSGSGDMGLIKYDANGVQQWARVYNGPENYADNPYALTLDTAGNAYLIGMSGQVVMATVKFSSDGTLEWVAGYDPVQFATPRAVKVDSVGNVYVLGYAQSGSENILIKYSSAGIEQWASSRSNPIYPSYTTGEGLVLDSAGNPYVTISLSDGSTTNMTTIRFDPNGNETWEATLPGTTGLGAQGLAIALDQSGNVLVCGQDYSRGGDFLTAKYLNCVVTGDTNASWAVDGRDIQSFLACLLGDNPDCPCADLDADGLVNLADLDPFVTRLLGLQNP